MYQYRGLISGASDMWNPLHPDYAELCGTDESYELHLEAGEVPCHECLEAERGRNGGLEPCGTNAAYNRHMRQGGDACPSCKAAHREYMVRHRPLKGRQLKPCGTVAAYRRHYQRGEKACPECAAAQAAYKAAWKAREAA